MGRSQTFALLPQDRSLLELSRYFRSVAAFLGNDSGITHLAAYLGCPTIALFGPTDPGNGDRSASLTHHLKTKLEDISVDEVLTVIRGRLPKSPNFHWMPN